MSGCWGATTPTRSPPATTSRTGPGRRATRGRCGCSRSCCRTRSGCWGATTPTRSPPATTSRAGPARRATARGALRLFAELLPDQERVLGRDHPDTLRTRNNIATWTGRAGDGRGACGRSRSCSVGFLAIRCGDSEERCRWLREGRGAKRGHSGMALRQR